MTNNRNFYNALERALVDDDSDVLRDGETMRVPMMKVRMTDAMALGSVARTPVRDTKIVDQSGRDGLALLKPGFRTTAQHEARDDAHY